METADVVLTKSDLLDAVKAIQLGRAVMRNIKQNLFWAFFYNIIGIPIAAGAFYGLDLKLNPHDRRFGHESELSLGGH